MWMRTPCSPFSEPHKRTTRCSAHICVEIADHLRAAELAGEPVAEGAEDRRVLLPGARRRRPGGDPIGLAEQVAPVQAGSRGRRGGGEGGRRRDRGWSRDELGVDDLDLTYVPVPTAVSESCRSLTTNAPSRNGSSRVA